MKRGRRDGCRPGIYRRRITSATQGPCRPAGAHLRLHGAEVLVAEHPNLTDIESIEVANQAEVIVREAMLERERILDAHEPIPNVLPITVAHGLPTIRDLVIDWECERNIGR